MEEIEGEREGAKPATSSGELVGRTGRPNSMFLNFLF
jgi:hypothetical protein